MSAAAASKPDSSLRSLQYSTIFYLFSIAILLMLIFSEKWRVKKDWIYIYFSIIGISTAYFDFLTYPIATLGIPLIMYFCMNDWEKLSDVIKDLLKCCICWGIGYLGMWAGKWILAVLLTDVDVIKEAFAKVEQQTSVVAETSVTLRRNINNFTSSSIMPIANLYIFIQIVRMIINKVKIKKTSINKIDIITCVGISLLPICWYIFASRHSYVHSFFTFRSLVVTAFAIMCMFAKLAIKPEIIKSKKSKKKR